MTVFYLEGEDKMAELEHCLQIQSNTDLVDSCYINKREKIRHKHRLE